MRVLQIAPGQSRLAAPGRLAVSAPLAGMAAGSGSPTVTYPCVIAGVSGWRDAGAITSMLDPTGAPITAFGASIGVGRPGRQVGGRRRPSAVAAQLAAEFDGPQCPADHRQHGHAFGRQHRRQQPTTAIPRRAAGRTDHGPDALPKQCRIPVAASLCSGSVDL
jgi:hypothetical protein